MRLTDRDTRLVKDIALSHAMSRDQVLALGYFSSVTRANTRLRALCALSLLRRIETPFFTQGLYTVGKSAKGVVGGRLATLLKGRVGTPRFLQHALCTNSVRIHLLQGGASEWRFEQQLWATFRYAGTDYVLKPDGLAVTDEGLVVVEIDLGHVTPSKFREKLKAYEAFILSGECLRRWKVPTFTLLTVTTGPLRARRINKLFPVGTSFTYQCLPHDDIGVPFAGAWS